MDTLCSQDVAGIQSCTSTSPVDGYTCDKAFDADLNTNWRLASLEDNGAGVGMFVSFL